MPPRISASKICPFSVSDYFFSEDKSPRVPQDMWNENHMTAHYPIYLPWFFIKTCNTIWLFNYLSVFLSLLSSSSSTSGHSEVEKDSGSSSSEPVAPECDRHVYKSVLEGGDIPLQGLRALNKRHGSSSSKGRIPATIHMWPVKWQVCVCLWMRELHIKPLKAFPAETEPMSYRHWRWRVK